MTRRLGASRICLSALVGLTAAWAASPASAATSGLPLGPGVLEGTIHPYVVRRADSLPWIAVRFGVHPVRLSRDGRGALSAGETLRVDQRRITPGFGALDGVVLNIPEAEVYWVEDGRLVRAYPVAVSTSESKMPLGHTRVVSMAKNPTWFVPKSIQDEMAERGREVITSVPPGPQNPLGPRWIGVWNDSFGMHGTNMPTSIKHYASHGCVRFLANDIKDLYARVDVGTPVHVLYQPVKLAADARGVWLSAYPDIYATGFDYAGAVARLARSAGVAGRLDARAVRAALAAKDGIIRDVSRHAPAKAVSAPAARKKPLAAPAPSPTPDPLLEPTLDDELRDIPPEWLIERSPDPWFDQP